MATHDLQLVTPSDTTMEALSSAVASMDLSNSTETVEPALAVSRTPASFLTLPRELRYRIYELLPLVPQGVVNVDNRQHSTRSFVYCTIGFQHIQIRMTGPRQFVAFGLTRSVLFRSLDVLHILYTSRFLHEEATRFLYASLNVKFHSFQGLRAFNDTIGPKNWSALTRLELRHDLLKTDFFDNIDAWITLCDIGNLSSLHIRVNSDVLDVAAAEDAHLRTRFARQLSLPGLWREEKYINKAEDQLNCLFRIAQCLVGQVKDTSGKRKKLKILSIGRFVGWRAEDRAKSIGLDALQSMDYDEIEANIMPRIERELEEAGWFE